MNPTPNYPIPPQKGHLNFYPLLLIEIQTRTIAYVLVGDTGHLCYALSHILHSPSSPSSYAQEKHLAFTQIPSALEFSE